ncbi:Xaa-Pro dipeptidase [Rhodovibrio sodomensis]|uniref:Xaa-Pro dipeptidase n=1 Tax=Rhodovibrio sodomensis TaxID=1088 RepID=A0ABS1DHT2_9PROT|nr:Xaa-Pro dipeptidase [Rhodovibrio sodomensis]
MVLHFDEAEFDRRKRRAQQALVAAGLDGLLAFKPETQYWLTGFDSFGYVFFQCLYFGADGRTMLLTRAPDLRQAQLTSDIEDIRIWEDREDASPADQLRDVLAEFGLQGARLGVETDTYGLTARNGRRLDAAMDGFCTLEEANETVSRLRAVKSEAEIAYVRKAAELGDRAFEAGLQEIRPGAFEGDVLAAMQGAVFRGGGDYAGNEFIVGSGDHALLCRYQTGRRHLERTDQLTLEWAGVTKRYHAALMRTVAVGQASPRQRDMAEAAHEALLAVEETLTPGNTFGAGFDAHARVLDAAGLKPHRLNACGYSLGAVFAPNWMDWPMLYHGNPVEIAPGMVIFVHIIVVDSDSGLAMCPGRTSLIGARGAEPLSRLPLELTVAGG